MEVAYKAKGTLKKFRALHEPLLLDLLQKEIDRATAQYDDALITDVYKHFTEYVNRDAKRLRASFVYYAHKLLNGEYEDSALAMGSVIEIMHGYLIALDDWMDLSNMRRGDVTPHLFFEDFFKKHSNYKDDFDFQHFGASIAVTMAVNFNHFGLANVSRFDIPEDMKISLVRNMSDKYMDTSSGQIIDVANTAKKAVSEAEVIKMLIHKTAIYTYENPLHSGAILANGSDEDIDILSQYAMPGGLAFQIKDDILGIFGEPDKTGKADTDDIKEGKYTLLVHHVMEHGTKSQKDELVKYIGKRDLTDDEHVIVKEIMEDSGSLKYSEERVEYYTDEAIKALETNKKDYWSQDAYEYLTGVAQYIRIREV